MTRYTSIDGTGRSCMFTSLSLSLSLSSSLSLSHHHHHFCRCHHCSLSNTPPPLIHIKPSSNKTTHISPSHPPGIMDLVVGAPGDHQNGVASSGAIYILSIQRDIVLRYRKYNFLPLVLGLGGGMLAALLIALFCWLFRRKGTTTPPITTTAPPTTTPPPQQQHQQQQQQQQQQHQQQQHQHQMNSKIPKPNEP